MKKGETVDEIKLLQNFVPTEQFKIKKETFKNSNILRNTNWNNAIVHLSILLKIYFT